MTGLTSRIDRLVPRLFACHGMRHGGSDLRRSTQMEAFEVAKGGGIWVANLARNAYRVC